MPFIENVSSEGATGELRSMFERQQKHYGYIPNYAKVFGHRPETLARWGRLLAEIRRPMEDRLFELATFVTAVELSNTGCALAHGVQLAEWISKEDISEIAAGRIPDSLSHAETAVVNYARKAATEASRIQQSDLDELRAAGFSDEEIFDIALTISGRAFLATLMDSLGVLLDSPMLKVNEEFRNALTVGRPIDHEAVEVMN